MNSHCMVLASDITKQVIVVSAVTTYLFEMSYIENIVRLYFALVS